MPAPFSPPPPPPQRPMLSPKVLPMKPWRAPRKVAVGHLSRARRGQDLVAMCNAWQWGGRGDDVFRSSVYNVSATARQWRLALVVWVVGSGPLHDHVVLASSACGCSHGIDPGWVVARIWLCGTHAPGGDGSCARIRGGGGGPRGVPLAGSGPRRPASPVARPVSVLPRRGGRSLVEVRDPCSRPV